MSSGCEHYKRKVMLVAPCCNKIYTCRFCHNAKENHELNRHAVLQVICMVCKEKQRARMSCSRCGTKFGQYFCLRCRFYDDEDKGQFHCEGCGICRVGGRENYSHCSTCNMCFNIQISDTHKCVVNSGKDNCGLCLEPIHTSILKLKVPQCGHIIHEQCSNQLIENNIKKCPTCRADFLFM
ncbi:Ring finger domain [Popillia japonica]|uniref:Ring finger domain n=1 Tax=Popillia japonica TaxID=7064 RepID=A0AAW1JGN9_POPJA